MEPHYHYPDLLEFTKALLEKSGLPASRADIVASTLLEADLMGHTTHGLFLLSAYLDGARSGGMNLNGEPIPIQDHGASLSWDGDYNSGPWLVHQAIDEALTRIKKHPTVTITISKSHHIGCLAAYPETVTRKGYMLILACSDPRNKTVAPFGGTQAVYSPNPLAVGIPTHDRPIIFDISMSSIANGEIIQNRSVGRPLSHPWLLKTDGQQTDDPEAFFDDPPATILPLGGSELGYKGFALGLLIEMLTSGLGGYGREKNPDKWGASVYLQLIDPSKFGGIDQFLNESSYLMNACLNSAPLDPEKPVRLPGHKALALRDKQKQEGLWLHPSIPEKLEKWGAELGISAPNPLS